MAQRHEIRRDGDGELLGFVVAAADGWTATTVFGAAVADSLPDRDAAEDVVRAVGLASLAEPWDYTGEDGVVQVTHIVEASTTKVTLVVGDYFPDPATRFTIPAPVGDALRRRRP